MSDLSSLRYRLGIDGGGTGTRAKLASADGQLLGLGRAGPSALGQGAPQAWRNVHAAAAEAFVAAGLKDAALDDPAFLAGCGLGLGLSGAENPGWVRDFLAIAPGWGRVALETDGFAALLGAHAGAPGAMVAVGTGSVGEALHADGRRLTVGGWGWQLGDEGGGAWLGQRALRHAQHAMDGRAPGGQALARAIWERCGADRARLLDWCAAADQSTYAALSPLVFELEHSDTTAAALIAAAIDAVQTIAHALDPQATLPLVISGSIGKRLLPRLAPALRQRVVDPAGDASDGALHLLSLAQRRNSTTKS